MDNKLQTQEQSQKMNVLDMFFQKDSMETAMRVCDMLAASDLVPKEYHFTPSYVQNQDGQLVIGNPQDRNKAIANCFIALNKAVQLGCDPLTIMQNMTPIYGRPSWSSSFLIGTVNTCGRFNPLKFRFGQDGNVKETFTVYSKYKKEGVPPATKDIDMPNLTCVAYTTERGSTEVLEGAEISIRMAFDEGWLTKDGSKWLTMPNQMLMYRAAAFWTRVYAPEVSQGLYTAEENVDMGETIDVPYTDVTKDALQAVDAAKAAAANADSIALERPAAPAKAESPAPASTAQQAIEQPAPAPQSTATRTRKAATAPATAPAAAPAASTDAQQSMPGF